MSIRKIKTRVRRKKENGRSPLTKTFMYSFFHQFSMPSSLPLQPVTIFLCFFVLKPPTSQFSRLSKAGTQILSFFFIIHQIYMLYQMKNVLGKHVSVPPDLPSQKSCRPHFVSSHSLISTVHGIPNCTARQTVLLFSAQ